MSYDIGNIERKKAKILIVDDSVREQDIMSCLCMDLGHDYIISENGYDAIDKAANELPDLILMDIMLPMLNGFEATKMIRQNQKTRHIPIIMITSLDAQNDKIKGIECGANDYVNKPFNVKELTLRIKNNLVEKNYRDFLENHGKQLEEGYRDAIFRLSKAIAFHDNKAGAHIKRIGLYCRELSLTLAMDKDFINTIHSASSLYDIGKTAIPDTILTKVEKLTNEEWNIIKSHTTRGANFLKGSSLPFMKMAEEMALSHHEMWSGTGYPQGLKGKEIPISARIVNLADRYDALRSSRPYKKNMEHEEALSMILQGCDRWNRDDYDPEILNAFEKIASRFEDIYASFEK